MTDDSPAPSGESETLEDRLKRRAKGQYGAYGLAERSIEWEAANELARLRAEVERLTTTLAEAEEFGRFWIMKAERYRPALETALRVMHSIAEDGDALNAEYVVPLDHALRVGESALTRSPAESEEGESEADRHAAGVEEAAIALMQMRGGPGVPRHEEAEVAIAAYLRLASPPAPAESEVRTCPIHGSRFWCEPAGDEPHGYCSRCPAERGEGGADT